MQFNIFEKIVLFIIGVISIVVAGTQWGLTVHRQDRWTYCWETEAEILLACNSTPQTSGSERYTPPAGNAAVYILLVWGIFIMIGFVLKGCHYWFESRREKKVLHGRA